MNALIMACKFPVNKVRIDSPNWGDREASPKSNWGGDTNYLWKSIQECRKNMWTCSEIMCLWEMKNSQSHYHVLGSGTDRAFF